MGWAALVVGVLLLYGGTYFAIQWCRRTLAGSIDAQLLLNYLMMVLFSLYPILLLAAIAWLV